MSLDRDGLGFTEMTATIIDVHLRRIKFIVMVRMLGPSTEAQRQEALSIGLGQSNLHSELQASQG